MISHDTGMIRLEVYDFIFASVWGQMATSAVPCVSAVRTFREIVRARTFK